MRAAFLLDGEDSTGRLGRGLYGVESPEELFPRGYLEGTAVAVLLVCPFI